jgi:hypothetical protein
MVAFIARFNPRMSDLNTRICLCTAQDVVTKDGEMQLRREEVKWMWASVRASPTVMSYTTPWGYPAKEELDRQTHRIIVREQIELDITTRGWAYEKRLKGPPRWYKLLGYFDFNERWLIMTCHLTEKSEMVIPPQGSILLPRLSQVPL